MSELIIRNMDDVGRAAKAMAVSNYFADAKDAHQAVVKILAGHEMGFGAFASMTGIHIISGKPAIGSNLIAAAIKRHPLYNFKVAKFDDKVCHLDFYENWDGKWEKIGESIFTMTDAQTAGLLNNPSWKKYPKNMLYARAISNGARWYCPDIFGGAPTYTPEELGATVDEDENVIDAEIIEPQPEQEPVQDEHEGQFEFEGVWYSEKIKAVCNSDGTPYYMLSDDELSKRFNYYSNMEHHGEEELRKYKAAGHCLKARQGAA